MGNYPVVLLVTELPNGRELVLTYNGTYTAHLDGQLVAEGFTTRLQETRPDDPSGATWSFDVPHLGTVHITRTQAMKALSAYQDFFHQATTAKRVRGVGRPPVSETGSKEISVTLPTHTVDALTAWAEDTGVKRGAYLRNLIVDEVEHRTIRGWVIDLIDNPGWQEHAIDAWIEGAEERGFGFHLVRTMLDQTEEIAVVRRDNWDNPDDATVDGREYMLTAHWPPGLDPADYGKGTTEVLVAAVERPLTRAMYKRTATPAPVTVEEQRFAAEQLARSLGHAVADSVLNTEEGNQGSGGISELATPEAQRSNHLKPGQAVQYIDPDHSITRNPVGYVRNHAAGTDMCTVDMEDGRELMVSPEALRSVSPEELQAHRQQQEQRREGERGSGQ